jgi:hypothetical protein
MSFWLLAFSNQLSAIGFQQSSYWLSGLGCLVQASLQQLSLFL